MIVFSLTASTTAAGDHSRAGQQRSNEASHVVGGDQPSPSRTVRRHSQRQHEPTSTTPDQFQGRRSERQDH